MQKAMNASYAALLVLVGFEFGTDSPAHPDAREMTVADTDLTDDTATITISVSDAWLDTDTTPVEDEDGSQRPHIGAATDLDAFVDEYVSGVEFVAYPSADDAEQAALDAIETLGDTGGCSDDYRRVTFDNGVFSGDGRWYDECGPNQAASVVIVDANTTDQTLPSVVHLQAELPEDQQALQRALCSVGLADESDAAGDVSTEDESDDSAEAGELDLATSIDPPSDTISPDLTIPCDE